MTRLLPCIDEFKAGRIDQRELLSVRDDNCMLIPTKTTQTALVDMQDNKIIGTIDFAGGNEQLVDLFKCMDVLKEITSHLPPLTPEGVQGYMHNVQAIINQYNQLLGAGTFTLADNTVVYNLNNQTKTITVDPATDSVFDAMFELFILENERKNNNDKLSMVFNEIHNHIDAASKVVADFTIDLDQKISQVKEAKRIINRLVTVFISQAPAQHTQNLQKVHGSLSEIVLTQITQNYRSVLMSHVQPVEAALAVLELDLAKAETIAKQYKPQKQPVSIIVPSVQATIKEEKKVLRFSEAAKILREKKETRFLRKNPTKNLEEHYPIPLRRQNQYAMKIIAISNDYDLLSTSPADFYSFMENLFDWPNEGQKGSIYNIKKKKELSWYQDVAAKLPEIRKDPTIEKSDGVVGDIIGYVQELYKELIRQQKIKESPVRYVDTIFQDMIDEAKSEQGAYDDDEMQQIVAVALETDNPVKWPTLLMSYTGARPSELYLLRPMDFDWERQTFYIDGTKTKTSKRTVPIAQKLLNFGLEELVQQYPADEPFLTKITYEQNLNARFQEMIKHLNLPDFTTDDHGNKLYRKMYSIRKAFSTWNGEPDGDKVEQIMGHSVRNPNRAEESTYKKSGQRLKKWNEAYRNVVDLLPW
jgi:Phage integrase family.